MSYEKNPATVALYVIRVAEDSYFGGFDAQKGEATIVADPIMAKKFTNKRDIKLRPHETVVEILVDLTRSSVTISEPFRPRRVQ